MQNDPSPGTPGARHARHFHPGETSWTRPPSRPKPGTPRAHAARSFSRATDKELDELAFADEHSFDRQRFYNIICLLYGQNKEKFASLVEDGTLPEGRAERCPDEYARADKAWDALLAPYVK